MQRPLWSRTRSFLACIARRQYTLSSACNSSRWHGWEVVIGIEVHAQIKSRAKLFSGAWTSNYDDINVHVDLFDAALPGTLPKLNATCVELAIRTAIGLEAIVQRFSAFDRKHYFYADLPAGYQITQNYAPLAKGGTVHLRESGVIVNIKQLQLEQDTAKTTFYPREGHSVIDLNRAGTGLMEIVSEPDMRFVTNSDLKKKKHLMKASSPEQAGEYVRTLQALLRAVGSCDGNMEQGSLRCDVNVSINRPGEPLGTRCEVKNLNSVKFMMIAITSEVQRHIALIEGGEKVTQETRGFDEASAETYALRSKEDAPDYRYMPDPNLPPLLLDDTYITRIRSTMPELPEHTRARLKGKALSTRDIDTLMSIDAGREIGHDGKLGESAVTFFDKVSEGRDPDVTINWITQHLWGQLSAQEKGFALNPISAKHMGELIDMVQDGRLTNTSAKALLKHMITTRSPLAPSFLAKEISLLAFASDDGALDVLCAGAIKAMPEEADAFRKGRVKVLNRLVGWVMRSSRGRADAKAVGEKITALLTQQ